MVPRNPLIPWGLRGEYCNRPQPASNPQPAPMMAPGTWGAEDPDT